jgi:glycosyltransferase 2 family protein
MIPPGGEEARANRQTSGRVGQVVRLALSLVAGASLCLLLFRGTDWTGVHQVVGSADPAWIASAILVGAASHLARARRLACLVRGAGRVRFGDLLAVNQVGLLVNYTVPARLGEAVRAVLLSKLERAPFSHSLGALAIDRIFDVVVMLLMVLIAWAAMPGEAIVSIPEGAIGNTRQIVVAGERVASSALVLAALLFLALVVLALLYVRRSLVLRFARQLLSPLSERLSERVTTTFECFSDGMHSLGRLRDVAASMGWSLVSWGANVLGLAFLLKAFSVESPSFAPVLIQGLIALATIAPIAPGMIGQYHVAVIFGLLLSVPGIEVSEARAISLVGHVAVLFQVGVLGLYGLVRLHFPLKRFGDDLSAPGSRAKE